MNASFYYDIVCPYAYMAFNFLKRFSVFTKKSIELKPILLGGLFKHLERDVNSAALSIEKQHYLKMDIARQAQFFSTPLRFHPRHPVSTVKAMRLIYACVPSMRESISDRLYRAYWQENLDIDDDVVLKKIAQEFSIAESIDQAKQHLIHATEDAFVNKVFGVPTIALNDRLYFGADRLLFIEQELGITWPKIDWQKSRHELDFYFDFSSPYSYLAWAEVKKAMAFGVQVNCKPILLGALFKDLGMVDVPMLNAHPHKTEYLFSDMKDWAQYRGVNFRFNTHFPLRTVLPLRAALVEPRVIDPIFSAAWAADENIGIPESLSTILQRANFDGDSILQQAENDEVKERLKVNTAQAKSRGVFGVPTFYIKEQQVFGQDRIFWIKKILQD